MSDAMEKLAEKTLEDMKSVLDAAKEAQAVKEAFNNKEGTGFFSLVKRVANAIKAGFNVIIEVVERVEVVGADIKLAGSKKKELAVIVINKLIDIPYIPETAEAYLIGFAIDAMIAVLNKKIGKDWLSKAKNIV